MDRFRQEKLQRYEEFVDKRLKPDLVHAIAERDKKRGGKEGRGRPDTQCIFVDIGLGFHVEFTWSEALNFISQREERLARQIEEYTRLIASIKAQIKLVYEGIRELLQLPAERSVQGPVF
ncbi:protein uxt like protein [Quercus suber]|uniref:Protein uxt like protein n=1 Tax=Quercus suber TaxID=58331 RepID=A0AAW0KAA2_QUESU